MVVLEAFEPDQLQEIRRSLVVRKPASVLIVRGNS